MADGHGFELPMTQEQLADTTGLTPVHASRAQALEKDGLISRKRRHQFPVARAQDQGDFSRQYLHLAGEDVIRRTARTNFD
jgi:hypothetical protein